MYLGLDVGTSGVKAVLIDADGGMVDTAGEPLTLMRPHSGWSEQDPDAWWQATLSAADRLKQQHPQAFAALRGIGLSGQMHGATLLDGEDRVLRPAILWNDGRSATECVELEAGCPELHAITGNLAMPGFTAPKLLWVAKHEPEIFARVAKVLLPKDYVRLRLSGDYASDMSDAAGTLWLDVAARDWSDRVLAATGLERRHMPELHEGTAPTGQLRSSLCERWGVSGRPVIAGGAGDNAASACGIGAVQPGRAFVSIGTSGVLFVSTDTYRPNVAGAVHTFCHALPSTWHQMGVILAAAASLDWLAGLFECRPAVLSAPLGDTLSSPPGVLFLPYLSGERTPHNDADARGVFVGLGHETDRAALTRAVLEGVAFAFRDCQEALKAAGTDFATAAAVGGGSRLPLWLTILATILDRPIELPADGDFGAAFGAARLALIAATGEDPTIVCTKPPTARTFDPDPAWRSAYEDAYRRYRALYPAVKQATAS